MLEATKETFAAVLKEKKAIVFFHKPGCSNCNTMKPLVEEFEAANPTVKVYSYDAPVADEVTDQFEIRVFPGIYHI